MSEKQDKTREQYKTKAIFKGEHPNSLLANATPEQKAKIRSGRMRAAADQRSMEMWANNGFTAGAQYEENEESEA